MRITKPIIIVGTGRCGSTLFHRLLAKHPQLMWLSPLCYKYPDRPGWNRMAVTVMDNPLLSRLFGEKIRPGENYRFWDKYAYGFSEPCRDLVRSDVTPRVKKQVRAALESMLTARRNRLLIKITGWPRIGFLNEIFEDAKFIHVLRDVRVPVGDPGAGLAVLFELSRRGHEGVGGRAHGGDDFAERGRHGLVVELLQRWRGVVEIDV